MIGLSGFLGRADVRSVRAPLHAADGLRIGEMIVGRDSQSNLGPTRAPLDLPFACERGGIFLKCPQVGVIDRIDHSGAVITPTRIPRLRFPVPISPGRPKLVYL